MLGRGGCGCGPQSVVLPTLPFWTHFPAMHSKESQAKS